mgnify:CR=1 FL=1
MTLVGVVLMLGGSAFAFLSAIGLLRFPDLYTRLHAAAQAGPVGAGLILLGVAINSADIFVTVRCVLGFAFLIAASPISANLLARAAFRSRLSSTNISSIKNIDNSR